VLVLISRLCLGTPLTTFLLLILSVVFKTDIILKELTDNKKHLAIILDSNNNILTAVANDFEYHAEDNAIKNIINMISIGRMKQRRAKRLVMYVFRVSNMGMLLSRPCEKCQALLAKYDYLFNRVYYSISNYEIGRYF
jgi:hypothetical protein